MEMCNWYVTTAMLLLLLLLLRSLDTDPDRVPLKTVVQPLAGTAHDQGQDNVAARAALPSISKTSVNNKQKSGATAKFLVDAKNRAVTLTAPLTDGAVNIKDFLPQSLGLLSPWTTTSTNTCP